MVFETWIAPRRLLVLSGELAILGTLDCFIWDAIEHQYLSDIEAALRHRSEQPVAGEVVIGTSR